MRKFVASFVLGIAVVCFFSPTHAVGQVVIDGVDDGDFFYNFLGSVDTAEVNNGGSIWNEGGMTIGKAVVNSGGQIDNVYRATITEVDVNGGYVYNGGDGGAAYIGTANVTGGYMQNQAYAEITKANVSGGMVQNTGGASITSLSLDGGTVDNRSRIDSLSYTSGTYSSVSSGWSPASIGTLTLAGNSADNAGNWGTVNDLKFDNDGSGILSIKGFADGSFSSGINVTNSVNLANAGISLDMSAFGYGDNLTASFLSAFDSNGGFNINTLFDSVFGTDKVSGINDLNSFEVAFGTSDSFYLINNGEFSTGWNFDAATGFVTWNSDSNAVPEPATLAILGLGLTGLAVARRRRK